MDDFVAMSDQTIAQLIIDEEQRQRDGLELIPSENYVSRDILTAMGSIFTNKYSEVWGSGEYRSPRANRYRTG